MIHFGMRPRTYHWVKEICLMFAFTAFVVLVGFILFHY